MPKTPEEIERNQKCFHSGFLPKQIEEEAMTNYFIFEVIADCYDRGCSREETLSAIAKARNQQP